jgi:CheY-like chemotaxis protein
LARILVIADDALIRETIKTMLQLEGHDVALVPHGDDKALQRLGEQSIDLAICDIFMRRGGGTETVAALRRLAPGIPIITMAGGAGHVPDPRDEDHAHYLQMTRLVDATTTIAKPFKPRDLFALIRQCLGEAAPPTG